MSLLSINDTLATGIVVVGVSGGADSVALLHWLCQWENLRIVVAHVNFRLRGVESDRDQEFVEGLAHRLGLQDIRVQSIDTRTYALERKISVEMAAREIRYEWFEKLRQEYGADAIAVGHHARDQVETVLLNLIRGTGGEGLRGMQLWSGFVWRPLLAWTKEEILSYISRNDLSYVEDSTNAENEYTRNKIRNCLLPLLRELNPSFDTAFLRSIGYFQQEQETLAHYQELFRNTHIYYDDLKLSLACEVSEELFLIRELLKRGISEGQIDRILGRKSVMKAESGAVFVSKTGMRYELFRHALWQETNFSFLDVSLSYGDRMYLGGVGEVALTSYDTPLCEDVWAIVVRLPKNNIIRFRYANERDRYVICGGKNVRQYHRSLFEHLKDLGCPSSYRRYIPVVTSSDGVDLLAVLYKGSEAIFESLNHSKEGVRCLLVIKPTEPFGKFLSQKSR